MNYNQFPPKGPTNRETHCMEQKVEKTILDCDEVCKDKKELKECPVECNAKPIKKCGDILWCICDFFLAIEKEKEFLPIFESKPAVFNFEAQKIEIRFYIQLEKINDDNFILRVIKKVQDGVNSCNESDYKGVLFSHIELIISHADKKIVHMASAIERDKNLEINLPIQDLVKHYSETYRLEHTDICKNVNQEGTTNLSIIGKIGVCIGYENEEEKRDLCFNRI